MSFYLLVKLVFNYVMSEANNIKEFYKLIISVYNYVIFAYIFVILVYNSNLSASITLFSASNVAISGF